MITVIARWESTQIDPHLEHRMWRQLKGAYTVGDSANFRLIMVPRMPGVSCEQYDTMEEALEQAKGQLVFLEPTGMFDITDIPICDITLVIGNTEHSNIDYAQANQTYRIDTPKSTDLYGINAGAIALAYWWNK